MRDHDGIWVPSAEQVGPAHTPLWTNEAGTASVVGSNPNVKVGSRRFDPDLPLRTEIREAWPSSNEHDPLGY